MKTSLKKNTAKILYAGMLSVFCLTATTTAMAQTYDLYAVQAINKLIADNGLEATPDVPEMWEFATWNDESPKQITDINLGYKSLSGALSFSNSGGFPKLQILNLAGNNLSELHISNIDLQRLSCQDCKLTRLSISGCTELEYLNCSGNKLIELNLCNLDNSDMPTVFLGSGQNVFINFYENETGEFTRHISLDSPSFGNSSVSYSAGILKSADISVYSTSFTVQTCKEGFELSGTLNLDYETYDPLAVQRINDLIANNELEAIPNAPPLWFFATWNNEIPKQLKALDLKYCSLTGNVSFEGLTTLQTLNIERRLSYSMGISKLDVTNCTELEYLNCSGNKLIELNLTGLNKLNTFIGYAQYPSITLTKDKTGSYTCSILLNSPTFDNNAIFYSDGILKSTNSTVDNTIFTVQTIGKGYQLNGIMDFTYSTTGINAIEMSRLKIYPNPTQGELTIESEELRIDNVEIFDITGKSMPLSVLQSPFSIHDFPAGIYFVKIDTEQGVVTKKIIKQ